eukprot:gene22836-29010_t
MEIDHNTSKADLLLKIPHLNIAVLPISASQSLVAWSKGGGRASLEATAAIKPAAAVSPRGLWASSSSEELDSSQSSGKSDDDEGECEDDPTQLFLFVPLAVSSHCPVDSEGHIDQSDKHVRRLQKMCRQARAKGVVIPGGLSDSECEFRFCQRSLSAMAAVCRPLFPPVLTGIQKLMSSSSTECVSSSSSSGVKANVNSSSNNNSLSFEDVAISRSRQLIVAVPLMSITFGNASDLTVTRPRGGGCAQTASRCAESLALYGSKVRPFLEAIVAGVHAPGRMIPSGGNDLVSSSGTTSNSVMLSNHAVAGDLRLAIRNKRKLALEDGSISLEQPLQLDTQSFSTQSTKLEIATSPCWSDASSAMDSRQSRAPLLNYLDDADASMSSTPLSRTSATTNGMQFSPERRAAEERHYFAPDDSFASTVAAQDTHEQLESIAMNRTLLNVHFAAQPMLLAPSLGDTFHVIAPPVIATTLSSPPPSLASVPPPSPSDAFVVSFLGTGCATPSKHRNNSCIMVGLTGSGDGRKTSLLLDAGEGTAAQIYQSVSGDVARYDAALLSIKVIWISHHHADHITGLPQLLEQIQRAHMRVNSNSSSFAANEQKALRAVHSKYSLTSHLRQGGALYRDNSKIMLIGGESVLKYFEYALSAAGLDELVTLYPLVNTLYAGATSDVAAATNGHVTQLRSVAVQHCHSSYGIVLNFATGHKLVYSGDCRPSQSLVKAGLDCDLLIHEATFDDSMAADALKKKHSTASEARGVAALMRAKHTVLTHFSQRYPVGQIGPQGESSAQQHGVESHQRADCSLALDFLRFSFPSQMRALPQACEQMVSILAALETERQLMAHIDR